jgi:hypothetical protein
MWASDEGEKRLCPEAPVLHGIGSPFPQGDEPSNCPAEFGRLSFSIITRRCADVCVRYHDSDNSGSTGMWESADIQP